MLFLGSGKSQDVLRETTLQCYQVVTTDLLGNRTGGNAMAVKKFTTNLQVESIVREKSGDVHLFGKPFPGYSGSMGLRVSQKGIATWLIIYRFEGKQRKYSFGKYPTISLADAIQEAATLLKGIDGGIDPNAVKRAYQEAETLTDLWEQYIRAPSFKAKVAVTQKEDQRKFDVLLKEPLGSMKLVDIRKKHLSAILSPLAETSPVAANRLYSLLSVLFKLALNKDLIEQHPMYGMDKPSKEKPRNRYLKEEEVKLLWSELDKCKHNVRDIFKLILLTCQRPGEVMGLQWSEIDMEKELWTLPAERTKTKDQDHLVPLSPQVIEILRNRLAGNDLTKKTQWMLDSEFVFPTRHNGKRGHISDVHSPRRKLIRDLEMQQWGAHDLRRSARTLMSAIGVAPHIGERILNHSLGKMEKTYNMHDHLSEKRIALGKLGRKIYSIVGLKSEENNIIRIRKQA